MSEAKRITLRRSGRAAYVKLISATKASLYIPGVFDSFLTRNRDGIWLLDHMDKQVVQGLWSLDQKDIYGTDASSVESVVNEELNQMVNEEMFK